MTGLGVDVNVQALSEKAYEETAVSGPTQTRERRSSATVNASSVTDFHQPPNTKQRPESVYTRHAVHIPIKKNAQTRLRLCGRALEASRNVTLSAASMGVVRPCLLCATVQSRWSLGAVNDGELLKRKQAESAPPTGRDGYVTHSRPTSALKSPQVSKPWILSLFGHAGVVSVRASSGGRRIRLR